MKMKRITVSNTLRTIYDWKCTQTYYQHDEEIGTVVVKEFYKFEDETELINIEKFLGRKPSVDSLLKQSGIEQ